MAKTRSPLALIAGPTASGKSALAMALAQAVDGVIVNADSAQVYRDLPILSAAPSDDDRARVEHRLFGYLDGGISGSAADWAALAKDEIADIHSSGRLPIVVGGTGMYLRTLLEGIAPVPDIDPEVRSKVREASVAENYAALEMADRDGAARLNPADTTRIARALEVVRSTGKTLAKWQEQREGGIAAEVDLRPLILLPPRDWLYARCDARFQSMIDAGAISEVETLLARGLSPALPVMRAIGVREIAAYLGDSSSKAEAIAAGAQATRNYAKRQYTWFAHQPPADWPRFGDPIDGDAAIADALALIQRSA